MVSEHDQEVESQHEEARLYIDEEEERIYERGERLTSQIY